MSVIGRRFEVKEGRPGTGKGLFARTPIKKGEFIIEYVGKKIPTKIADTMTSRYLFELNDKWTLDGPPEINLAGYINHCCEPNTEAEIEEDEAGEDHIMIHAVRDIAAGEELTIDYDQEYFDEFIKPVGCKCGATKHRS
jgi:SET domain-containing protein